MQANENRPPFIKFGQKQFEDRTQPQAGGRYPMIDKDMIYITPHGSQGKNVMEYVYEEWIERVGSVAGAEGHEIEGIQVEAPRFPSAWVRDIKAGYKAWKEGITLPVNGTPILTWPPLSPAQRSNIIAANILTVEQLAAATDEACDSIGMGGRNLRLRAAEWVKEAQAGSSSQHALEIEALKEENARLVADREATQARLAALEAAVGAQAAAKAPTSAAVPQSSIPWNSSPQSA